MGLEETKSKFVLRSRRVATAALGLYVGLRVFGESVGISLPEGGEGVLGTFFDALTKDDGVFVRGFEAWASILTLAKVFGREDGAALKLIPLTGNLPLAPSFRAAAVVLLALGLPGLALDAGAAPAYVPSAPAVGRWMWEPAAETADTVPATAYNVHVSRDGGAYAVERTVAAQEVTLPAAVGEVVQLVVEPVEISTGAIGPLSDASEPQPFIALPDLNGDGVIGLPDYGLFLAAFGCHVAPSPSGGAAPVTGGCAAATP